MKYYRKTGIVIFAVIIASAANLLAQNPIVPERGLCDPQVRIYNNKIWLYATHDATLESKDFVMYDWWVWSSTDLVNWQYESTLYPQDTYFGKCDKDCWATDAMSKNGKYYFYFSRGFTDIGVVVSDNPNGPWHDPLKKPLVPASLTPVEERDPSILMDDDGSSYIVFGVWDFYIAKLNDNMISLAEEPKLIVQDKKAGPYGAGKTDDKSFIHKYNGKYYLSWGCYYAMSDNVYGPYTYKGSFYTKDRLEPDFQKSFKAYDRDRHGSFFELNNQWYFICNDNSIPGSTPYFRNSVISYIHYKDNGEIEPVYLTRLGVARYDAADPVEAENYFKADGINKRECPEGGYEICDLKNNSSLTYTKVMNLKANTSVSFRVASGNTSDGVIEIHENDAKGKVLGTCKIANTGGWNVYKILSCQLKNESGQKDIVLVFKGSGDELLRLNWFNFK